MSVIRFAIVGTGGIARAYETAFQSLRSAQIVAGCDTNPVAAQAFAERVGCASYSSLSDLLNGVRFDAAVICTPPASHEAVACDLLRCHALPPGVCVS